MLTQVNYEVKGQLAKLLATEDLIIENRKVSTASFDTERRVLTLPMWEKASGVVYDLLVGHEVGHALHTPADNWTIDYPDVPMSYVNVLEDVRIEKFMNKDILPVKHFTMDTPNLLNKISLSWINMTLMIWVCRQDQYSLQDW